VTVGLVVSRRLYQNHALLIRRGTPVLFLPQHGLNVNLTTGRSGRY
jgi:hypothetical protein